MLEECKILISL
jgi:hypothetical protein